MGRVSMRLLSAKIVIFHGILCLACRQVQVPFLHPRLITRSTYVPALAVAIERTSCTWATLFVFVPNVFTFLAKLMGGRAGVGAAAYLK